jgi:hypothetical protein
MGVVVPEEAAAEGGKVREEDQDQEKDRGPKCPSAPCGRES